MTTQVFSVLLMAAAAAPLIAVGSDFRLSRIGVVMLGASDVARSVAFYRDRLGLKVTGQTEGTFVFLDGGGVTLALSQGLAQGQSGPGSVEIVFAVDHVKLAYERLKANGVEFINEPRLIAGSNWAVNFRDPDGHLLSVFGPE